MTTVEAPRFVPQRPTVFIPDIILGVYEMSSQGENLSLAEKIKKALLLREKKSEEPLPRRGLNGWRKLGLGVAALATGLTLTQSAAPNPHHEVIHPLAPGISQTVDLHLSGEGFGPNVGTPSPIGAAEAPAPEPGPLPQDANLAAEGPAPIQKLMAPIVDVNHLHKVDFK